MIELKGIRKSYETGAFAQRALDGVSIAFRTSEFVAVLGPSGSGKTTLLNILGGLDHADEGDIVINGVSTRDYRAADWDTYRNHRIGFIFQGYNLIPHQTVLSNVELALTLAGLPRAERRERARAELERVGLGEHVDKRPGQLSGGQMQRVAIARALVNDPDIVLADEPTGALDGKTGVQVMDLLEEIARDRLVIMVTHNPELAERYATRVVSLSDGRVTDDTNPLDVGVAAEGAAAESGAEVPPRGKLRASMGFATALSLSFNNLMTKKGRTFMTAFAGSIGIIGIAAILALSNGVNGYIAKVEEDTLSSYPLSISKSSTNLSSLVNAAGGDSGSTGSGVGDVSGSDVIPESTVLSDMFAQIKSNDLSSFKAYLDSGESGIGDYVNAITYNYGITPRIYESDTGSGVTQLNPSTITSGSSDTSSAAKSLGLSLGSSGSFEEMLDDQELLDSQYDVVAGRWAESYDECVLVMGKNGTISDYTLYNIGVLDPTQLSDLLKNVSTSGTAEVPDTDANLTYDEALGLTFKVVDSSSLYRLNADSGTWTDMSGDSDYMRQVVDGGITLKVVGVVCPNETTSSPALSQGIAYTHALTQRLMSDAASSDIVRQQLADPDVDVFTGRTFADLQSASGSSFDMSSLFTIDQSALANAIKVDTSTLDASALDVDTSGLVSDADLSAALSNLPLPDFSSSGATLTEEQSTAVSSDAQRVLAGFLPYYFAQHPGADVTAATDFSTDFAAYLQTPEAQAELGQMSAVVGEATSSQVQSVMSSYMTDTFEPYVQGVMQEMASEMSSAVESSVRSSLSSLGDSMGGAVTIDPSAIAGAIKFNMTQEDLTSLLTNYMNADQLTYDNNLSTLGYADEASPDSIDIYPKDFADKERVLGVIDAYNQQVQDAGESDRTITYTDIMGTLISSVTHIVDMISYVLIAFVSISLVVSSIMIGIITYISVLERRKEIGILRAMGASKRNIANVFNAETIIEGLIAGAFAIAVVLVVSVPVNAWVLSTYHVSDIMQLPWTDAIALVAISVLLTFVAGLIPASGASRRDPVEALRSE